ncbi:MAG: Protein-methionine-sulfoxide reductase catalytic subunit MsrP [uncultured Pyrinomonadaceae bacterium]|uniref:Protein-methionine-sulfoxide reductase catalytic subunit MsrP n=1 Tax=uncultured Pyrinomonadaceae bacterium TaxID=2283094 RepID=A0A6J4NFN9_9BACT|nr:MAG: Protein-methionine-sulfoxide reductase catalytic subunit MsrP [uncultured Pyrinomonadaceae bacterium]
MIVKNPNEIKSSEITDEKTYLNRRNFIRAGLLAGTTLATAGVYRFINPPPPKEVVTAEIQNIIQPPDFRAEEKLNSFEEITNYNNFYEFSTSKTAVARRAENFVTRPWAIEVGGLVQKPKTFAIEDLLKFEQEERIYRFRCVEGWSMVIPWVGFPLKKILDAVEPLGAAKYVAFETLYDSAQMQSSFSAGIDLPYLEGLRLDEAAHPLTILATGLYGKLMPNQNGAPVRLVVPWKYGFKSIKSIVKISLTEKEPPTTWNIAAPSEYGFYSNVNPNVRHPRWSQATENHIGEYTRRPTLPFNGYAEQVESLYSDMNLKKYF